MKRGLVFFAVALAVCAVGVSLRAMKIRINGKLVAGEVMKVDDKLYVPVSALKAGGVRVAMDGETLSLRFPTQGAAGGTMQQAAVEGKIGEWLFNGIWRFQVKSIAKHTDEDGADGWKAVVEIRNGSKFDGYSPAGTGWQGVTIVLDDGNSVGARSDAPEMRDSGLNQGAGASYVLHFDTDSASKPDRLILRFDPKGVEGTPLKFTVADPSFRVSLKP